VIDKEVNDNNMNPSRYTAEVHNIPADATEEELFVLLDRLKPGHVSHVSIVKEVDSRMFV